MYSKVITIRFESNMCQYLGEFKKKNFANLILVLKLHESFFIKYLPKNHIIHGSFTKLPMINVQLQYSNVGITNL